MDTGIMTGISIVVMLLYFLLWWVTFFIEKTDYNKGCCKRCGGKFILDHMTDEKERVYVCQRCDLSVRIDHIFVDWYGIERVDK